MNVRGLNFNGIVVCSLITLLPQNRESVFNPPRQKYGADQNTYIIISVRLTKKIRQYNFMFSH